MNLGKRPFSILVLSCLYIAIGTMGFAYHFPRPLAFHYEDVWIEGTELLAFVAGVFMLRGHNWARWLALAWIAFHVAISFPVVREIAIHSLFLAVIVWLLFQSRAGQYFASKSKREKLAATDRL
jgi:hypothetical protein